MALTYEIADDVLLIRGGGKWDFAEMKKILGSAAKALGNRRLKGVLFDDRNSRFKGYRDDFNDMARFRKGLIDRLGTRIAVVVSDDLHFGLARMSAAIHFQYGIEIQPFKEMDKARAWLAGETGA